MSTKSHEIMTKPATLTLIILVLSSMHLNAQTLWMKENWPSYEELKEMPCHKLAHEWVMIRNDLTILMKPENLDKNSLWNEAKGIYNYINQLQKAKKCNSYNPNQLVIPLPNEYYSYSEAQLVEYAKKCLHGMVRLNEGVQILRIGADANYKDCQYNLGMMLYAIGDKVNGKKWLRSASYLGSSEAKRALESINNTESNQ